MACRHPLEAVSVFGPDTSLARLDLVPRKLCSSSSPHGPRLRCAPGFGIRCILATTPTIICGKGNLPAHPSLAHAFLPVICFDRNRRDVWRQSVSLFSAHSFAYILPYRISTPFYLAPSGEEFNEHCCVLGQTCVRPRTVLSCRHGDPHTAYTLRKPCTHSQNGSNVLARPLED